MTLSETFQCAAPVSSSARAGIVSPCTARSALNMVFGPLLLSALTQPIGSEAKPVLTAAGSGMTLHGTGRPMPAKMSDRSKLSVLAQAAGLDEERQASAS